MTTDLILLGIPIVIGYAIISTIIWLILELGLPNGVSKIFALYFLPNQHPKTSFYPSWIHL